MFVGGLTFTSIFLLTQILRRLFLSYRELEKLYNRRYRNVVSNLRKDPQCLRLQGMVAVKSDELQDEDDFPEADKQRLLGHEELIQKEDERAEEFGVILQL